MTPEEMQEVHDWLEEILHHELAATKLALGALQQVKPKRLVRRLKVDESRMTRMTQHRVDDTNAKIELLKELSLAYLTGDKELMRLAERCMLLMASGYRTEEGYKAEWRPEGW